MKRLILAVLIVSPLLASGQKEPIPHFRRSYWGDSVSDVLAVEGKPSLSSKSKLIYKNRSLGDFKADVAFSFIPESLHAARYDFNIAGKESHEVFSLFADIKGLLTEKYGESISDVSKLDIQQRFLVNACDYHAFWNNTLTVINVCYLKSKNGKAFFVEYIDRTWQDSERQREQEKSDIKRKQTLKDF